jgi:hypothetical protein
MNCRDQEEVARSRKFALNRETLRTTGTGKPGIIFRQREFATIPPHHPFSWLQRIILRAPSMRFLRKGGIYRSDVVPNQSQNQILGRDRTASRWSAPGPGKRTRREDHALLIVRDEFRTGYSLIGLLASRARLRFTGARRLTCSPQRPRLKGTFLLCQKGDISTLP